CAPRFSMAPPGMTAAITAPIRFLTSTRRRARAGKLQVLLLMGSGVVAAAQIGKAIIAVPMIRSDLALGLGLAGLIVAMFATLGQGISIVAAMALGVGGLAPGAIYAAAPHAAPTPSVVPPTIGLVQQASSLGQFH